jgi:hypothetical protein
MSADFFPLLRRVLFTRNILYFYLCGAGLDSSNF